jgi:hypothetical protein
MSAPDELRPAYRTLNEPTRLLGLSLSGWAVVLAAFGAGYGWLTVSPLPWRLNVSIAVIALGAPAALLILREQTTITPARLLAGVIAWRARPARLVAVTGTVARGGVRLDAPLDATVLEPVEPTAELPWIDDSDVGETGR